MNSVPIADKLIMLWRAETKWRKPKAAKTVIYDRCGSDVLLRYIKSDDVEILDVRGESINLYVLLKATQGNTRQLLHG